MLAIFERTKDMGVLFGKGGLHGNVNFTLFFSLKKLKTVLIRKKKKGIENKAAHVYHKKRCRLCHLCT